MKQDNTALMSGLALSNIVRKQRSAYHEAGHAVAIHFNDRLKKLPPVFLKSILDNLDSTVSSTPSTGLYDCIVGTKGGRLIPDVYADDSLSSGCRDTLIGRLTEGYRLVFEADIVNLLIGPVAEAKFVAGLDNEVFNQELFTVKSLKNYGGEADLAIANDYLQHYSVDPYEREEWMRQFLIQAFYFVDDSENWKAIAELGCYILASHEQVLSCEDLAAVLDNQGDCIYI
ncbi:MAG: hypothetical protein NTV00_12290 [Methylococcales bacterium]|nr:hypothetical protein [Methylococcales bacterium]